MAHSLKIAGWFLLGMLLAACSTTPLQKTPSDRLTSVLSTQQKAEAAYHSNNMEQATALYLQLTKMIPQEADYWYMLGNTYVRTQQPDHAVEAYQQAIVRDPNHARAWHNLGIVRMRQAMAAFVSSASTAKAGDPMHEVSTQLVNELSRIGSAGATAAKLQDQISAASPLPVTMTGTPATAAVKSGSTDPYPTRRRPGAAPGTEQQ